jgi:aspartate/methionine/tyrosine aminotransferase
MDATPVVVQTAEARGFKMTVDQLKAAITPRTKAIILNSPCNPTGATYTADELKALVKVLLPQKILIVADDIYEKFVYDGTVFTSIASLGKEVQDQTMVINGVSKTYSMTGWRIGYAAGSAGLIAAMDKIQTQNVSNPVSFCQKAAVEALGGPQDSVRKMVTEFDRRRKTIEMGRPGDLQLVGRDRFDPGGSQGGGRGRQRFRQRPPHPVLLRHFHGQHRKGNGPDPGNSEKTEIKKPNGT